jgi:hypothetical protein
LGKTWNITWRKRSNSTSSLRWWCKSIRSSNLWLIRKRLCSCCI